MSPPSQATYRAAPEVRTRKVDGNLVVLDLARDVQYAMNELGARVWELATSGASTAEIGHLLVAEYCVEEPRARADVERILRELVAAGLLLQTAPPGVTEPT